jgi:2'-5' RNA ligase
MPKDKPRFKKERPQDPNSVEASWRLFLALPLPNPAIELVDRLVMTLSDGNLPVRWVAPHTAHLTLHFLGDTAPERAELLRLSIPSVVNDHRAFSLRTGSLGVFPNEREPRIVWLGLQGSTPQLISLHAGLGEMLRSLDLPVESRPLQPHITLGRVRDRPSEGYQNALRRQLQKPEIALLLSEGAIELPVTEILLIRSFLEKTGVRHDPLGRYPLRPA